MKLKVECSQCGSPMKMDYSEADDLIQVHPCSCGEVLKTVRVDHSTIIIGE